MKTRVTFHWLSNEAEYLNQTECGFAMELNQTERGLAMELNQTK
jgi:hypothetical protein